MRYLSFALAAEGSTDDRFLPPVLERSLAEIGARTFRTSTTLIGPPFVYRRHEGPPTAHELVDLMNSDDYAFSVLFFHRDCGPRFSKTEAEWYVPFQQSLSSSSLLYDWVRVCPRMMTEAWMLIDLDAVRAVVGHGFDTVQLGVPVTPDQVEGYPNPKDALERIAKSAVPRRRRHRIGISDYYAALGETVSLQALRRLRSFRYFEEATRLTLARLADPA